MTGAEAGFLLLTSRLGNPERKILSTAQLRILSGRVKMAEKGDAQRQLTEKDLAAMGYGHDMAHRILELLGEKELLHRYCYKGEKRGCFPLTRISAGYPKQLWQHIGEETTGCLWYKGDVSLLMQPKIALVGSRDILESNRYFAEEVGRQAARQGYVLVSGNARGADRAAQRACLGAGGKVISVIADRLDEKLTENHILYLSEDEYDAPFSAHRAISRNRLIHTLAEMTFVAQCRYKEGGTWNGTAKNLHHGWSSVFCYADGSVAMAALQQMGADLIDISSLQQFEKLPRQIAGFFDDI